MIAWWLAACALAPNGDPVVVSVNDVAIRTFLGVPFLAESLPVTGGEVLPLRVDVRDPDGDPVSLWWPWAPAGLDFPPEAREGTWTVPTDERLVPDALVLLAVDDRDPPGTTTVLVPVGPWTPP